MHCEQLPGKYKWTNDMVEERICDMLAQLSQCVNNVNLPMYFDTNVNLLETANRQELNLLSKKISEFCNNKSEALLNAIKKNAIEENNNTKHGWSLKPTRKTNPNPFIHDGERFQAIDFLHWTRNGILHWNIEYCIVRVNIQLMCWMIDSMYNV